MSDRAHSATEPARRLPTDPDTDPVDGTAVCLSGGGYRAMLFHTGCLWRLYETGWLDKADRLSSVSGGSIIAAVLALAWPDLARVDTGRSELYRERVVAPIRRLADRTIDAPAILTGLLVPSTTVGQQVAAHYRRTLFGDTALSELPQHPVFVFNATNVATGDLVRFSKASVADWRVGRIKEPAVTIADAVACSSAFPPFLSPFRLRTGGATWTTDTGNDLTGDAYRGKLVLTDGGVYDNLGLETTWKRCRTLFVSDGGGTLNPDPRPRTDWPRHMLRVTFLLDHQVRALRKRQLIDSLARGRRDGTYVGVRSDLANYGLPDTLPAPVASTTRLANTATRLKRMRPTLQEQLINWGYAIADAGLRRHLDPSVSAPAGFPYPAAGVG